jgi:hypothetical protein
MRDIVPAAQIHIIEYVADCSRPYRCRGWVTSPGSAPALLTWSALLSPRRGDPFWSSNIYPVHQLPCSSLLIPQIAQATYRSMADFTDRLKPAHDGTATLRAERNGSGIHVDELANHLLSRDEFLERQKKVLSVLSQDKIFDKDQQLNLSRPDRYQLGLARAKAIQRIMRREGWGPADYTMAEYLNDEMSPYFLHMSMFG